MITVDYVRRMALYNRWQNENLYVAADRLTDEERYRERGAFFGSIHAEWFFFWSHHSLLCCSRLWPGGILHEIIQQFFDTEIINCRTKINRRHFA